ncbi:hypothetical protein AB7009_17635, partial [Citrobacter werkmanii]
WLMMSLWDALRMNMMISYQELVRTFLCWVEILRCITAAHTLNKSLLVNAAIITHSLPEPAVAQLPQAQRIEKIFRYISSL